MTERHTSRALARDLPAEFRKPDGQAVEAWVTKEHAEQLEQMGVKVDPKRILPGLIPPAKIITGESLVAGYLRWDEASAQLVHIPPEEWDEARAQIRRQEEDLKARLAAEAEVTAHIGEGYISNLKTAGPLRMPPDVKFEDVNVTEVGIFTIPVETKVGFPPPEVQSDDEWDFF